MANLAKVFKEEIRRLARKEVRQNIIAVKRLSTQHRRHLAELRRLQQQLVRRINQLESRSGKRQVDASDDSDSSNVRYSAKWVKAHRDRLGLSAADYGRLLGVSGLTIYNWEKEKSKPRRKQLQALATIRTIRKREALRRLENAD
ncbi:MAG: hypothetical protein HJJLKODD_00353 [Phycisphaerae bacterium]|nr:hypothetical protein [Phycisphaerae bacterium]